MSQRSRLRKAVAITAAVAVVVVAALLIVLAFMLDRAARHAEHSPGTLVPPGSPASAAAPLLPHPPLIAIIGGVLLLALGIVLRFRRR